MGKSLPPARSFAGANAFGQHLPALIARKGEDAVRRFLEFFTAQIRNKNTRLAYARAVMQFCRWCEARNFTLELVEPITVAAYIEDLGKQGQSPP